MLKSLVLPAIVGIGLIASADISAHAASAHGKKPNYYDWTFAGPFGHYDKAALQRGFKVYQEVCASCHSLDLVAFRNLTEETGPHFSEEQIKTLAAEYTVIDAEPDEAGDPIERPAVLSDKWPSPWENQQQARASNNNAYPPDFSLIAKARAAERGFPNFIFDIFTQYQEMGPDYITSLLTGYTSDEATEDGLYENPYFLSGEALAMAPPLSDELVTYDDGSPETVEQYAQDVSHFLMWAAEPKLEQRKSMGFVVMVFLAIFAVLLYMTKKKVFANAPR